MKKFKYIILLLILSLSLALSACKTSISREGDKAIVYTSFLPVYNLTKSLAEDSVDLRMFMPASAAVHDWEPSPRKIRELAQADLLLVNGANMEAWLDDIRATLPDLKIVVLADNAELISYTGAAIEGDFKMMQRADLSSKKYSIEFGHNHEEYIRVGFYKNTDYLTEDKLLDQGVEIMGGQPVKIAQEQTFDAQSGQVYEIQMAHWYGIVHFNIEEEGEWIIYTDRIYEQLLPFRFLEGEGQQLDLDIMQEGSALNIDTTTYDPHSWLSLENAKSYLSTIYNELVILQPQYENTYHDRLIYQNELLNQLLLEYRVKFAGLEDKSFIVMNYAFEYLAREFGLFQYPLQGLTSIAEPSISSMVRAIDYAKKLDIKTIYYEYGISKRIPTVIAEELDRGKILPLSSMEYLIAGKDIDDLTYIDLMRMNLENLYKGMSAD